jgi:hypothetical protein
LQTTIDIIPSKQVDKQRWDHTVQASDNGLIYAQSQYLDAVTDHWDGLVINQYEQIMPLPWRMKAGIKYLYTPPFTQQLGLIGKHFDLPLNQIIKRIHASFRYGTVLLNAGNGQMSKATGAAPKSNLLLNLNASFNSVKSLFRKDHVKNAQKALKAGLIYTEHISIQDAVLFYASIQGEKTKHVTAAHYQQLIQFCNDHLLTNKQCFTRAVVDASGTVLSTALFLVDQKRIYNILNATNDIGKSAESNHLLFYSLIQEFAETNYLLDFEGSSIPGIKYFYEGFGCQEEIYSIWHYNKLPFPLSLIP